MDVSGQFHVPFSLSPDALDADSWVGTTLKGIDIDIDIDLFMFI